MLVNKDFIKDFALIANYYKWNINDIAEMKGAIRDSNDGKEYVTRLANAIRNGYRQDMTNNFIRLINWELK